MKRIDVERKEINKKDYIRRTARLSDVSRHIKEDAIIYHNGKPILLYKVLSTPPKDVRWAVKNIKYSTGKRTHGLVNTSAVFGYSQGKKTNTTIAPHQLWDIIHQSNIT